MWAKCSASSNPQKAEPLLEAWIEKFGNRVYSPLTRTERVGEEDFILQAAKLAAKYQVGVVAHNDVHFLLNRTILRRMKPVSVLPMVMFWVTTNAPNPTALNNILKRPSKCLNCFQTFQVPLNTYEIAKRCNVSLQLGTYFLPDFPIPRWLYHRHTYFEHLSRTGLEQRLNHLYPVENVVKTGQRFASPYDERIKYEVDIIPENGIPRLLPDRHGFLSSGQK